MTYGQWPGQNEQQGEQAGGDGRRQPPDRRYGQQPHEQGNGQRGYAPDQYQPQPGFQPTQPFQPGPQPPLPPPRGKSWPARHKTLTGIFAFVSLIIIVAANSGCSSSSPGGDTTTGLTTTPSATITAAPSRQAAPAVATTQKAHPKPTQTTSATSQAPAPPAPTTPAPAPTTAAAVVAPPPPAAPTGCHPLTNGGNCYEPGEFCRNSDHNASGVAGDGEAITCENNNGWRWEPS